PMAIGPPARKRSKSGGLPPVDSPSISSIRPLVFDSSTMRETVDRCKAVSCEVSAREIGSLSRTQLRTIGLFMWRLVFDRATYAFFKLIRRLCPVTPRQTIGECL